MSILKLYASKACPTSMVLGIRRLATKYIEKLPNPTVRDQALGSLTYSRNVSRVKIYGPEAAQIQGDTAYRFLFRRLGHAYETYPLIALIGFWVTLATFFGYLSLGKMEIWLNRSSETAPWDWSRIRDNYWKKQTIGVGHTFDATKKRLEIMEQLQDEMLEAAKKRGTR